MPYHHLTLCGPHLLLSSIFPSISIFTNESVFHIRRSKYWSFSFTISPSKNIQYCKVISLQLIKINEKKHSGLISFMIDWLDLLAVQGTLKSPLHTIVQKHQFFNASFLFGPILTSVYMTTGKIIALTTQTFVRKVMSLLFNMLSRLIIASHGCSHHLQ